MNQGNESQEGMLIAAINANNWNEIFALATSPKLINLRDFSNVWQDKVDPELFITTFLEDDRRDPKKMASDLRDWLECNKEKINNPYMYALLTAATYVGSQSQIDKQTAAMEKLSKEFPDRWEAYLGLAFSWISVPQLSAEMLHKAEQLNPPQEIICLWSMVLSGDNLDQVVVFGNQGYAIHKNCLFLFLMARILEKNGRAAEARELFSKIVTEEPEGSYLHKKAKSEIGSSCFIATLVYQDKYAPEVEALRYMRDRYLANKIGAPWVRMYYRVSPGIVEGIRDMPKLLKTIRSLLNGVLSICKRVRLLG